MSVIKWSIVLPVLLLIVTACHKRPPAIASPTSQPAAITAAPATTTRASVHTVRRNVGSDAADRGTTLRAHDPRSTERVETSRRRVL
jgi:hypothetical protein